MQRKKGPFSAPPATLDDQDPLRKLMEEVLFDSKLDEIPFFDANMVRHLFQQLPELGTRPRVELDPVLTVVLSACALHDRYQMA